MTFAAPLSRAAANVDEVAVTVAMGAAAVGAAVAAKPDSEGGAVVIAGGTIGAETEPCGGMCWNLCMVGANAVALPLAPPLGIPCCAMK